MHFVEWWRISETQIFHFVIVVKCEWMAEKLCLLVKENTTRKRGMRAEKRHCEPADFVLGKKETLKSPAGILEK